MRASESLWSPYLTDTWDGAAGSGADAIYSGQAWIYTQRTPTGENKSSTRSAANATGSQVKYRQHATQASWRANHKLAFPHADRG